MVMISPVSTTIKPAPTDAYVGDRASVWRDVRPEAGRNAYKIYVDQEVQVGEARRRRRNVAVGDETPKYMDQLPATGWGPRARGSTA